MKDKRLENINKEFPPNSKYGYYTIIGIDNTVERKSGSHFHIKCKCICGKIKSISSQSLRRLKKKHCGCVVDNNLVGKKFGNLLVKTFDGFDKRYKRKRKKWSCECLLCGSIKSYLQEVLTRGDSESCGCNRTSVEDLTGKIFGKLKVINRVFYKKRIKGRKRIKYLCKCACGKKLIVLAENLQSKNSTRCKTCGRPGSKRPEDENYNLWRKGVFKRDNYTCVCCGKKGYLNAHHLNGWNWAFAERYNINNGVTLCGYKNGCHYMFHKQFGKGNNTRYQFELFLSKYRKTLKDIL